MRGPKARGSMWGDSQLSCTEVADKLSSGTFPEKGSWPPTWDSRTQMPPKGTHVRPAGPWHMEEGRR